MNQLINQSINDKNNKKQIKKFPEISDKILFSQKKKNNKQNKKQVNYKTQQRTDMIKYKATQNHINNIINNNNNII